jgi:hypothetical protein
MPQCDFGNKWCLLSSYSVYQYHIWLGGPGCRQWVGGPQSGMGSQERELLTRHIGMTCGREGYSWERGSMWLDVWGRLYIIASADSSVHPYAHRHSAILSSLPLRRHHPSHVAAILLMCCPETVVQVTRVGLFSCLSLAEGNFHLPINKEKQDRSKTVVCLEFF